MSDIAELVKNEKFEEAIALPADSLKGRELFFLASAYLSLGKGEEALQVLLEHRDELYGIDPILTMKSVFEIRFLLEQYDEAEEDRKYFENLPYVSQEVEEVLRSLPSTIAATRFSAKSPAQKDYEKLLETLASPSDDLMLLSALNGLKKFGDLEDYRGLVEEILVGPHHDDVKTYALMLLSAKGSDHKVTIVKNGKSYEVNPARLGTPYGLPEYRYLREKIMALRDKSLADVAGELLDLYALQRYPERFLVNGEEDAFLEGLLALARTYLGQGEGDLGEAGKRYRDLIGKSIAENPPLLG